MSSTENWKQLGNDAFKNSDFSAAIGFYSKAIEADPSDPKPLVNRSIARASLLQWKESAFDARKAIQIDPKYTKAHFRFVRALIAMNKVKDARYALSMAFKECGEQTKDFKDLEEEIFNLTGIPLRPKSTDFEVIGELGDGNFSKVYKTFLKATKQVFAIKAIERVVIDKMKRRHPNIQNEILMEKRVLHKLNHPGVATLYCTFQDAGTLYYMNEYIGGGDLWTNLHEIIYDKASQENTNLQKSLNLSETELFDAQSVRKGVTGAQVGVHWSLLPFYFTQMLSAVEHMHQHGIVHRDIKPENIMITEQGYLKFVDFGTAKDFLEPNLNGPEFVGTPEYMCPGTVKVKRDAYVGIEADLWALGATLFQMVLGMTPFNAPSPFLTFLRIKRGKVEIPYWVPSNIAALIRLLLTKEATARVAVAAGDTAPSWIIGASHKPATNVDATNSYAQEVKRLSYNTLRHSCEEFFVMKKFNAAVFQPNVQFYGSILGKTQDNTNSLTISSDALGEDVQKVCLDDDGDNKDSVDAVYANMVAVDVRVMSGDETHGWKTSTTFRPLTPLSSSKESDVPMKNVHRVLPRLHDICIRAVGEAAVTVAFAVAENGGVRPSQFPWMQRFSLNSGGRVSEMDRQRIMHFLTRKQKLQIPSVYRLFFQNLPDSRCLRANPDTLEYVGFNRTIQGHYNQPFHFAYIAGPQLGHFHHSFARSGNAHATELTTEEETQEKLLRLSIAQMNKLRPKFIVLSGPFVSNSLYHGSDSQEDNNALAKLYWGKFRRLVARVSDTISVLFVPSPVDLAYLPNEATNTQITAASMLHYRQQYGADYYGFWFEGMRGLVVNSSLFFTRPEETDDVRFFQTEQIRQLQWLEEEIEQCKLCATSLVLFAYHPWYRQSLEEEDDDTTGLSSSSSQSVAVVPKHIRMQILTWLRHHKVRYVFAGVSMGKDVTVVKPFANQTSRKGVAVEDVTLEDKEDTEANHDSDIDTSSDEDDKEEKEDSNKKKDDEDDEVYVNEDEQFEGPEMLFSAETDSEKNEEMMIRMVYVQEYESVHQDYLLQAASVSNPTTPVSHTDDSDVHQKKHLPATMQALVSDLQSLLTQPVATKK